MLTRRSSRSEAFQLPKRSKEQNREVSSLSACVVMAEELSVHFHVQSEVSGVMFVLAFLIFGVLISSCKGWMDERPGMDDHSRMTFSYILF